MPIDIEAALVAWITVRLEVPACTLLPADLAEQVPLMRVARIGGTYDGYKIETAVVDVHTFAADGITAGNLARALQAALHELPQRQAMPGVVVNKVVTNVSPNRVPYGNPSVERVLATYRITMHPAR